jgi:hypothetical protein
MKPLMALSEEGALNFMKGFIILRKFSGDTSIIFEL